MSHYQERMPRLITFPCTSNSSASQWVLFSQACGHFLAREHSQWSKNMISLVWDIVLCCVLISFSPGFNISGTSCFTRILLMLFGCPNNLWVYFWFLRKSVMEMGGVCVKERERERERELLCCNALITSSVYFWWHHAHKHNEGFLRRESERPPRSWLEGTTETTETT